jgi:hypothetical protein
MNHAFLCGYLAASGDDRETSAVLAPREGACCVELRHGPARTAAAGHPGADGAPCARDTAGGADG